MTLETHYSSISQISYEISFVGNILCTPTFWFTQMYRCDSRTQILQIYYIYFYYEKRNIPTAGVEPATSARRHCSTFEQYASAMFIVPNNRLYQLPMITNIYNKRS